MFEIYIKLVGSNKVENYLKESLFIAIAVENWRLIEDINDKKYHSDFSSNADDLTCIELMMAVEEEFDLEIPDEKCSPYYMMTVKDLYDAIISCLKDQE